MYAAAVAADHDEVRLAVVGEVRQAVRRLTLEDDELGFAADDDLLAVAQRGEAGACLLGPGRDAAEQTATAADGGDDQLVATRGVVQRPAHRLAAGG